MCYKKFIFVNFLIAFNAFAVPQKNSPQIEGNIHLLEDIKSQCVSYGEAGFLTTDPANWLRLTLPPLPQTTLLSKNRTNGFSRGSIKLSPFGLKLQECGSYWVYFSVFIVQEETNQAVVPIFLSVNGAFDPTLTSPQIAGVATLQSGSVTTITGSGIVPNVEHGTFLTLIAGAGGDTPVNVNIIGWTLTAHSLDNDYIAESTSF